MKGNRITIRNCGGKVIIAAERTDGIRVVDSAHFNVIGDGTSDQYGIKIRSVFGGHGIWLSLSRPTTDYTLSRIEITGVVSTSAIFLLVSATCDDPDLGKHFAIRNVVVSHTWVHHNGKEGMYIGSSNALGGKSMECNGVEVPRFDPLIDGLDVFGNLLENNGQDGLQFQGVLNADIHDNVVRNCGLTNRQSHRECIRLGKWVEGIVHHNETEDGRGNCITVNHLRGKLTVFENTTRGCTYGIWVYTPLNWIKFVDKTAAANLSIWGNTIIEPDRTAFLYDSRAGAENAIRDNVYVKDVPQMPDDDPAMIAMKNGGDRLTFEGNKHERTE